MMREEVMEFRKQGTPCRKQVKDPQGDGGGEGQDRCLESGPSTWKQRVES